MEIYIALVLMAHIFSGILWIGILYYFNFGQALKFPQMEASARSNAVTVLVPHLLQLFRWSALSTVVFGIALIIGFGIDRDGYYSSGQFRSIAIGGTIGIAMALNVWFIIWPVQQKIIAATRATIADGTPAPANQPKWARTALLASRTNTMLSIPMLFFMVGARNLPSLWGN